MRIAELVNLNGNRKGGGHNKNKCRWGDRRENIPKSFPNRREFFFAFKTKWRFEKEFRLDFSKLFILGVSLIFKYLNIN